MFDLRNKVAVISGAASGIGKALAKQCAAEGMALALIDVNEAGLKALQEELQIQSKCQITIHPTDLTNKEAVSGLSQEVISAHHRVDLLVNNAGVALGGSFSDVSKEDFDWVMEINFNAHVHMTRAFLDSLRLTSGQIVNVSSVFGLAASAGQTAYCASKFALRGFSEALSVELAKGDSGVGVSVVHPGGVKTAIAASAKPPKGISPEEIKMHRDNFEKKLRLSPEKAAQIILNGVKKRKRRIIVGRDARLLSVIQRLMPEGYQRVMEKA